MKYALNLDADGRVLSVTFPEYGVGQVLTNVLPEGDAADYRYVDGAFVYDPLPAPVVPPEPADPEARIAELEAALELLLSGVTE